MFRPRDVGAVAFENAPPTFRDQFRLAEPSTVVERQCEVVGGFHQSTVPGLDFRQLEVQGV